MELIEDGENTILKYVAKAETGGKLAQLGGRLITSTAKKLSKMFFEKFEKIMSGEEKLEEASDRSRDGTRRASSVLMPVRRRQRGEACGASRCSGPRRVPPLD